MHAAASHLHSFSPCHAITLPHTHRQYKLDKAARAVALLLAPTDPDHCFKPFVVTARGREVLTVVRSDTEEAREEWPQLVAPPRPAAPPQQVPAAAAPSSSSLAAAAPPPAPRALVPQVSFATIQEELPSLSLGAPRPQITGGRRLPWRGVVATGAAEKLFRIMDERAAAAAAEPPRAHASGSAAASWPVKVSVRVAVSMPVAASTSAGGDYPPQAVQINCMYRYAAQQGQQSGGGGSSSMADPSAAYADLGPPPGLESSSARSGGSGGRSGASRRAADAVQYLEL
jgi:hypothetical protein